MKKITLLIAAVLFYSCSSTENNAPSSSSEWLIPISEVLDGGPGKDGIPALTNPAFTDAGGASYLNNSDLVLGFKVGNIIRAYPHAILDWHEIANDNLGDVSVAVVYCPLTGTGIGWSRMINNNQTTFGVSGLLYNTNIVPYDRATNSNWSQLLNKSVNGPLMGQEADLIGLFETDWLTWKTIYPNTQVLSSSTGFSRTYGTSPYGDYNTNNNRFLFPVSKDNRLPLKEKVLAIFNDRDAKVYRFSNFLTQNLIQDVFKNENYIIAGNSKFMIAFKLEGDQATLSFEYIYQGSEVLLSDNEGNQWNIFGEAISGPRQGTKLNNSYQMMGFWFTFPSFYTTEIYQN